MSSSGSAKKGLLHPVSVGGLVLAVWSIPWIVFGCSTVFEGQRYFFLADDPAISMRYGRNLARGLGLVWNAGDRVEGYSNFLWTVYLGLLHLLPLSNAKMALPVILTNVALGIVGAAFVYKIARMLNSDSWFVYLAVLAYALNGDLFEWMVRGFETSLLATLLLAAFYRVLCDTQEGKPRASTHLLIISLSLVRVDAILLSGLLMLWAVYGSADRKRAVLFSAASLVVPAAHGWFRWVYYGDLLPNTAYLKVFGFSGRVLSGIRWVARFYVAYFFASALLVVALTRLRSLPMKAAAAFCFVFTGYVAYAGGDIFIGFRFLAPIIPLVLLASLFAAWHLTDSAADERVEPVADRLFAKLPLEAALVPVGVVVFAVAAFEWRPLSLHSLVRASVANLIGAVALGVAAFAGARTLRRMPRLSNWAGWSRVNPTRVGLLALFLAHTPILLWTHRVPEPVNVSYVDNVHIGMFLHDHTPPDARIADTWAGLPPYFSERPSIDLLGKCDKKIAREPVASEGTIPGHNKFDYDYALGDLHPDYVVAAFKLPVTESQMRQEAKGDMAFIGRLYFNEVFRRHCLPHPVPMDGLRTLFACDWSADK